MLVQVSLLALAVFQVVNSEALLDDKIDPVDVNYVCISVSRNAADDKKSPILLIHGMCGSLSSWKGVQLVLALRTYRRVCAIDLRNHGDSPWSNRTDVEAMAVDVGHFLDKQEIQKVNFIGHSLGGKTSIHYTLKHPERVDSLIVEDMRPNSLSPSSIELTKTYANLLLEASKSLSDVSTEEEAKKRITDSINKKLDEMGFKEKVTEDIAKHLEIRCTGGKCEYKVNLDLLQKFADDPYSILTESKGLYEGPTLFIYGKLSPFRVNEDEKEILKLFPNAELVGVDGADHSIHVEHKEFVDEVVKFLGK